MFKRKLKKKEKRELKRITEYMISGGAYFWSGYGTFFVLDKLLGASFFWAKSGATLVGWVVNFVLQRYWVFNNKNLAKHQTEVTTRYIGITLTNFVLDFLIVFGLKEMGISPYIGQFIAAGFFTVWNYLWYRYYVFPEKYPTHRLRVKHSPYVTRVAHKPKGA